MNEDYEDYVDPDSDIEVEDCLPSSDDEEDLLFFVKDGKDVLRSRIDLDDGEVTLNTNVSKENLLYDPNIDKDNENWMKRKRTHGVQGCDKDKANSNTNQGCSSDAILSCPACLTTVCVDCQRHEIYKHQFRAMFVMNCRINLDQFLRYEKKNVSKKRRTKYGPGKLIPCEKKSLENSSEPVDTTYPLTRNSVNIDQASSDSSEMSNEFKREEIYNPVKCDVCSTEIAVFDSDEVYHFFNVIESIA